MALKMLDFRGVPIPIIHDYDFQFLSLVLFYDSIALQPYLHVHRWRTQKTGDYSAAINQADKEEYFLYYMKYCSFLGNLLPYSQKI